MKNKQQTQTNQSMISKQILLPFMAFIALTAVGSLCMKSYFHSEEEYSFLLMQNIEALTQGTEEEYIIGPAFTNWKQYHIQCQETKGVDIMGVIYTTTTTYWADVCGKGSGNCWEPAGC